KAPIFARNRLRSARVLALPFMAALLLAGVAAHGSLLNRWSFNKAAGSAPAGTTFTDSISGAVATVEGNGATLTGTTIVLPGTTTGGYSNANISAFLDLPNGILSSKTN